MKKWIALCLSLVMVLSCCGMAASAEERYLGVMLSTNIMSLDTNLATDGESFEVIADCVDGLMQMDADGAAIPALAESYDLSEDGKTYTFHLRDAKWSNGTPVTAADFVFAWRRICKEAGEYAYMFVLHQPGGWHLRHQPGNLPFQRRFRAGKLHARHGEPDAEEES